MAGKRFLLGCVLASGGLLGACGDSQDTTAPHNQLLGDAKEGAPLAVGVTDPGILRDPADYQPAKVPGVLAPGAAADAGPGMVASGDADAQVRILVDDLINAIRDIEVELALGCFNPDHVAALDEDQWDPLFNSLEAVDRIGRRLEASQANRVLGGLRSVGAEEPRWDLLDAEHASVTPNLALVLFGPVKRGESMAVALQEGEWKFQFNTPLTATDVADITAYHEKLLDSLQQIQDWLDANENFDETILAEAARSALNGEPLNLPAGDGASGPGEDENPGEEPGDTP